MKHRKYSLPRQLLHLSLMWSLLAAFAYTTGGCAKNTGGGTIPAPTPQTLEQRARDGIATASGFLSSAQTQYHDQCVAAPTGSVCVTINKAGAAENTVIDALRTYCAFGKGDPLDAPCKPVTDAAGALSSSLSNLTSIINDVKGLVK